MAKRRVIAGTIQAKVPLLDSDDEEQKISRHKQAAYLASKMTFNPETYEPDGSYREADTGKGAPAQGIHTVHELVKFLENNKNVKLEASVLAVNAQGERTKVRMDRMKFLKTITENNARFKKSNLREGGFGFDEDGPYASGNLVGEDYQPLVGGPFYKQLYLQDYLKMNAASFFSYHHDPVGRRSVEIIVNFTLGRGWRADCKNKKKLALWRAFEKANNLQQRMHTLARELSCYGEVMLYWIPGNKTKIGYQLGKGQEPPTGIIPRVRLMDPSTVWDICTFPEDIERVLFYQVVTSTQYQLFTGNEGGSQVPTLKFIYQQIPAEEIMHFKINVMSNEKRGRSDMFPSLGYQKRLRDCVNFSLVSQQKQAAWSIDTTIAGDDTDIKQYITDQSRQTQAPAGSEFVHTDAIKREFMSAPSGAGSKQQIFEWALSMAAMGYGLPVSYYGTHLSGDQTKASAFVGTEPAAKQFQMRQEIYNIILQAIATRYFKEIGYEPEDGEEDDDLEFTFPEIIVQDRTAKLKDLVLAETRGWITQERAATVAAKELGFTEYEYAEEKAKILAEKPEPVDPALDPNAPALSPLTAPAKSPVTGNTSAAKKSAADNG